MVCARACVCISITEEVRRTKQKNGEKNKLAETETTAEGTIPRYSARDAFWGRIRNKLEEV